MAFLGWAAGTVLFLAGGVMALYCNVKLARLAVIDGKRYVRFRDISYAVFGRLSDQDCRCCLSQPHGQGQLTLWFLRHLGILADCHLPVDQYLRWQHWSLHPGWTGTQGDCTAPTHDTQLCPRSPLPYDKGNLRSHAKSGCRLQGIHDLYAYDNQNIKLADWMIVTAAVAWLFTMLVSLHTGRPCVCGDGRNEKLDVAGFQRLSMSCLHVCVQIPHLHNLRLWSAIACACTVVFFFIVLGVSIHDGAPCAA